MKKPGKASPGKKTPPKEKSARGKSSQPRVEKSPVSADPSPKTPASVFPIVGVGASAGGLEAATQLLKHLPADTGMGFVLVQHLDPAHESALAQILGRTASMPVLEVTPNLPVEPNRVYVIPPDKNLSIERGILMLPPRSRVRKAQRAIDFFFEALAHDQQEY